MKRLSLCLLCLLLLLTGCGSSRAAEQRKEFAERLSAAQSLRFTAGIRAEYPDKTVQYRLSCEEDGESCTLRVLEPEEIAGITLRLAPDGAQLCLDDLCLDTGPLDRYGLSPVSALPALTEALRNGHLESRWTEGELLVWELVPSDELIVRVWLDGDLTPQRAELISDGRVSVYCEIEDWAAEE